MGSWGSLDSQPSLFGEFETSERRCPLASTYKYTHPNPKVPMGKHVPKTLGPCVSLK